MNEAMEWESSDLSTALKNVWTQRTESIHRQGSCGCKDAARKIKECGAMWCHSWKTHNFTDCELQTVWSHVEPLAQVIAACLLPWRPDVRLFPSLQEPSLDTKSTWQPVTEIDADGHWQTLRAMLHCKMSRYPWSKFLSKRVAIQWSLWLILRMNKIAFLVDGWCIVMQKMQSRWREYQVSTLSTLSTVSARVLQQGHHKDLGCTRRTLA